MLSFSRHYLALISSLFLLRGDLMSVWGCKPKRSALYSADGVECSRLMGVKEVVTLRAFEASRQVMFALMTRDILSSSPDGFCPNAGLNPLAAGLRGFGVTISWEFGFEAR